MTRFVVATLLIAGLCYACAATLTDPKNYIYYGEAK